MAAMPAHDTDEPPLVNRAAEAWCNEELARRAPGEDGSSVPWPAEP